MLSDMIQEELLCELKSKKSLNINRDFLCQQCDKKFQKHAHLIRHVKQKHQNQRTYLCSFEGCDKTFKRDTHLKRHMISHTHEKPHKCSQCIMAFGYKHHLDRHIKVIHNNQLLQCPECEQKFIKRKALSKHYMKVHGNGQQKSNNATQSSRKKQIKKNKKIKKNKNCIKQSNTNTIEKDKQIKQGQEKQLIFEDDSSSDEIEDVFQEQSKNQNEKEEYEKQKQKQKQKVQKKYDIDIQNQNQNQSELFRCIYVQCPTAFRHKHELARHIQRVNHQGMTLIEDKTQYRIEKKINQQQKNQKNVNIFDFFANKIEKEFVNNDNSFKK